MKKRLIRVLMLAALLPPASAHSAPEWVNWPEGVMAGVLDTFVIRNGTFVTMRCLRNNASWCSNPPKDCPTPAGWSMDRELFKKGRTLPAGASLNIWQAAYDVLKEVVPPDVLMKCTPKEDPEDWKLWRGR
jgi:hypothetical protein